MEVVLELNTNHEATSVKPMQGVFLLSFFGLIIPFKISRSKPTLCIFDNVYGFLGDAN